MYDDKPVPKVIDFGVAKAIEQRLTEKTVYTHFGTLVGTYEYMSPEQAEMNAFGVDTRSDIYALGVLLYELLTGTTPLERQRLREAAFDEIRRIIKEEEPPRPSVRLSTSETLAKVAAARKTDPAKLSRLMRGELDWVVMRCLEKDRSRRYDNASALARDVERYLKDEPVEARPPSAWYRFRKATRRHRTALSVAGVVAATVVLGTTVSLWQVSLARADRERAEKAERDRIEADAVAAAKLDKQEEERIAERRQEKLDRATEAAFSGVLDRAHDAIVEAEAAGVSADQVHWLNGLVHYQRGAFAAAIKEFESAIKLKPSVAAQAMMVRAYFYMIMQSGNPFAADLMKAVNDLNAMTPVTPEDYMCRGYALSLGRPDPRQKMDDLDKAIAMRDSPIALAFRAAVEGGIGYSTTDLGFIQRALDDIRRAKRRLPDNSFIRFTSLIGCVGAASLYDEVGQHEKEKETALKEAEGDAEALADQPVIAYVMARVGYFEYVGKKDAALELLKNASAREETKELVTQYALALYRKNQVKEALDVLDKSRQPENLMGQVLRIMLMAEEPNIGPAEAYDSYLKLAARRERETGSKFTFPGATAALLFLGMKQKAAEFVRDGDRSAGLGLDQNPLTKYLEGGSEEEYMKSGWGGRFVCLNHYLAGLVHLSEGDRKGAQQHFQKSVDTHFYGHIVYPYAHVFLARMKRDPEWPAWIPVKE
jgi:tetratricopeptide (TPR) repeat protein